MRNPRHPSVGFSLTELLIGVLVTAALGAATYKVLGSHVKIQLFEVGGQTQNKQLLQAMGQLEADLKMGNPVWARQGVSTYFPHPGFGPQGNVADVANPASFNLSDASQINDAITFLTIHPQKRQLFRPTESIVWPKVASPGFSVDVPVNAARDGGLTSGDVVLVNQSHQWVLMKVAANGITYGTSSVYQAKAPTLRKLERTFAANRFPGSPVNWLIDSAYAARTVSGPMDSSESGDVVPPDTEPCDPETDPDCDVIVRRTPIPTRTSPPPPPPPTNTPVPTAAPTAAPTAVPTAAPTAVPTAVQVQVVTGLKLARLDSETELQKLSTRGGGVAVGYVVTSPGPPEASFDSGPGGRFYDNYADNNVATFTATTKDTLVTIEPVQVVTYRVSYLIKDGSLPTNLTPEANFVRNSAGQKELYLVRDVWSNSVGTYTNRKRTVLMPLSNFRLSFDIAQTEDPKGNLVRSSLWGGADTGAVFENAGLSYARSSSELKDPMDLSLYFGKTQPNAYGSAAAVLPANTYKIAAVSTYIETADPSGNLRKHNFKISVSSPFMKPRYQEGQMSVSVTEDLGADETGSPAYIDYGNGTGHLIVPASSFVRSGTPPIIVPEAGHGKLLIRNRDGTTPGSGSVISFNPGSNKAFYPTSVTFKPGNPPRGIVIGGMMVEGHGSNLQIKPALAYIDLPPGDTLQDLASDNPTCGTSAGGDCEIQEIHSSPNGLRDTSGGIMIAGDTIFVASLTKTGKNDPMQVFKSTANTSGRFTNFDAAWEVPPVPSVVPSSDGQILTSMLAKPLSFGGRNYLGLCVGNRNDGVSGNGIDSADDLRYTGSIHLRELSPGGSLGTDHLIAYHNSPKCVGLHAMGSSLVISGRLATQVIPEPFLYNKLRTSSPPAPLQMQLDEIVGFFTDADGNHYTEYADGYQVDPGAIRSNVAAQLIQGLTGTGVFQRDGLNFDFVLANKGRRSTGETFHDASLTETAYDGNLSRVVASLEKDPQLNRTLVRAVYIKSDRELVTSLVPPGGFVTVGRRDPTLRAPLPDDDNPRNWFDAFREIMVVNGPDPGPDDPLPIITDPPIDPPSDCTCENGCACPPGALAGSFCCPGGGPTPTPTPPPDLCEPPECLGGGEKTGDPPPPPPPPPPTCPPGETCIG